MRVPQLFYLGVRTLSGRKLTNTSQFDRHFDDHMDAEDVTQEAAKNVAAGTGSRIELDARSGLISGWLLLSRLQCC